MTSRACPLLLDPPSFPSLRLFRRAVVDSTRASSDFRFRPATVEVLVDDGVSSSEMSMGMGFTVAGGF